MRNTLCTICLLLCLCVCAQESSYYNFSLLRQNDSINVLADDSSVYGTIKSVDIAKDVTLSFGGGYRFQAEGFVNQQFDSDADQTELWYLNRILLHSHLKVGKTFELFAELNSSTEITKSNPSPVDVDKLSLNQLFARYRFTNHWNVLVGRQNMRLGSGRLIDIREGPNVRLSFDMVQLQYEQEDLSITGFMAVPVQVQDGVFDNDYLRFRESVSSIYVTKKWSEKTSTDIYSFYKREDQKTWNVGTADDERASIGVRHFGTWKRFIYDNEFIYQFGKFGDLDISAWTTSFNIKHPINLFNSIFFLGAKTELISGDRDQNDGTLGTFDGLYPRGAYFGRVATFGPSNLFDIHPYLNAQLGKWSVELDYVAFWRFSVEDGVYGPPLTLDYPDTNDESFIGHQIGTDVVYTFAKNFSIELETNFIFPDEFLTETGLNDTLFHTVLTVEYKF